jgi:frataxin-like iron-binding protein CyaY
MTTLSEQDFRVKCDEALEEARRALLTLADREGFEIEFSDGTLNLLFDEPSEARFVVSPNAPVKQIWVSAMARGYKLPWSPEAGTFALNGEPLSAFLVRLTHEFLNS